MLNVTKSTVLTGTSNVSGDDGKEMTVVVMSASITDDEQISVTKTIQNKVAYISNTEVCNDDIKEFENMAFALVK